jgi:outer membrane protein assembly factor BamA
MMGYRIGGLFGLLFCIGTVAQSQVASHTPLACLQSFDCSLAPLQDCKKQITTFLSGIPIHAVKITADYAFDEQEIRTILGCQAGQAFQNGCSVNNLWDGITLLAKKHKFTQLKLTKQIDSLGLTLALHLTSAWTLERVRLSGSLIGKDRYRSFYLMEPGDVFDQEQHEVSVEKIRSALVEDGYYNVQVHDTLTRDKPTKSIVVSLDIEQGKQFVVDDVTICLNTKQGLCGSDCDVTIKRAQKRMLRALKGAYFSKKTVDDETKKLLEFLVERGYLHSAVSLEQSLNTQDGRVRLCFEITLKYRNQFEFFGNLFFTRKQLLDQVLLFGSSAVLIPPSLIAEEIVSLYKQEGFFAAQVTWQEDGPRCFYFIKEGRRAVVKHVKLEGVSARSAQELIKTYFSQFLQARFFNAKLLRQAFDCLTDSYLELGFWDIALTGYDYEIQKDGTYDLIVRIKEGAQRLLAGVSVEQGLGVDGVLVDVASQRPSGLRPSGPRPFSVRFIQEQRQALLKALQAQGKIYVTPRPEFIEHADGLEVVWKFSGYPEAVSFGKTVLVGSGPLPAQVITRELAYKEGELWDQKKIEQSVARLKSLNIFDLISLTPEDPAKPEARKTMVLKYAQDTPYEVRARLGIQGVNRNIVEFKWDGLSYKLGGSFFVKNPFNQGDHFRFDLDFSRYMYTVSASYHFPWFIAWPVRTELKGYSSHLDQPVVVGNPAILYRSSQDGILLGFMRNFSSVETGVNIGVESMNIKPSKLLPVCDPRGELARAIHLDPCFIDRRTWYWFIEPTVIINRLDNRLQPTKGTLTLFSLKGMVPPSACRAAFCKFIFEQSVLFPLGGGGSCPWVLALRARAGTIVGAKFSHIIPIERFYLGGAYSVRSYEPDLVPPLNPFVDSEGKRNFVPTGGRSMVNGNAEIRFPIYSSLGGVVFADVGALSDKGFNVVTLKHAATALGFGLRLHTPVGPLRFDIGWKLSRPEIAYGIDCSGNTKCRFSKSFAWYLALGNPF